MVLQVGRHASELAVDEVKCGTEVLGADAHKRLYHVHLRFAASAGEDVAVELRYQVAVGLVRQVEVSDDSLAFDPQCRQDKCSPPSGAVLTLETMPEHPTLGRLDDKTKESGILQLRILAADE